MRAFFGVSRAGGAVGGSRSFDFGPFFARYAVRNTDSARDRGGAGVEQAHAAPGEGAGLVFGWQQPV